MTHVTQSREISHMSKIFKFEIFTPLSADIIKVLHFDVNLVIIGYLVTEL